MSGYYDKQHTLEIDPERVKIFTLKSSSKKKSWYVRILRGEGQRYFQKSLKTDDLGVAKERATKLYLEIWSANERGVEFVDKKFCPLFIEFMKDAGLSHWREIRVRSTFNRYFSEFFKGMRVSRIDGKLYREFVQWRCYYWRRKREDGTLALEQAQDPRLRNLVDAPSIVTLKSERQMMKQFLYWCADKRFIEAVPPLKVDYGRFSNNAFRADRDRAKALPKRHEFAIEKALYQYCIKDSVNEKNRVRRFGRLRLYYFIYICQHSLIRPSTEATGLKWSDVQFEKSEKYKDQDLTLAIILVSESKTGEPRSCVMPYNHVRLLMQWRDALKELGLYDYDGYVFPKAKGAFERTDAKQIGRLLKRKLIDFNLHRLTEELGADSRDDRRHITLYSIVRHTGITRRIEDSKWDVGTVAKMAGTSIQQISSFYFEAFVRQDPDRYAFTYRDQKATPVLREKTKAYINDSIAMFEKEFAGFDDDPDMPC
jgi:hypothetical protein